MDYDSEELKSVCDSFDLLNYIEQSGYEPKRRGDEYVMSCPIHANDDTPSLFISPEKQRWYCFGCKNKGSIIDWFIKVEHLTYRQAVDKLCRLTGAELKPMQTASSLAFFKSLIREPPKMVDREILPESYYDQFEVPMEGEPKLWLDEGIKPEMIRKYNIRINRKANRIMYPVYDNNDNLIGAKGRTMFQNYKILGISKYMNMKPIGALDYFQGMHENRAAVLQKGEAIIFEGIKSVMLADGFGYSNCISAETSVINDAQARILIEMGIRDVVIAFDSDVTNDKLRPSVDKLRNFVNLYVIKDKRKLLGEKMSPVDIGENVWKELYMERVKYV